MKRHKSAEELQGAKAQRNLIKHFVVGITRKDSICSV